MVEPGSGLLLPTCWLGITTFIDCQIICSVLLPVSLLATPPILWVLFFLYLRNKECYFLFVYYGLFFHLVHNVLLMLALCWLVSDTLSFLLLLLQVVPVYIPGLVYSPPSPQVFSMFIVVHPGLCMNTNPLKCNLGPLFPIPQISVFSTLKPRPIACFVIQIFRLVE